jgi:hypothetical protein
MRLFIKVQDGVSIDYPCYEDNLIQAYGEVPAGWELFVRTPEPTPTAYEVLSPGNPTIERVDGVWTDVWPIRSMTTEEKLAKQQAVKNEFAQREPSLNWATWTFNENTCEYEPPIPFPEENKEKIGAGVFLAWHGAENNWKDTPARPQDEKTYKFDYSAWAWVEVTE